MNFFVEFGIENFPSRFIEGTTNELVNIFTKELEKRKLPFEELDAFGSSVRLVLKCSFLIPKEGLKVTKLGPPSRLCKNIDGSINEKGIMFAKANGIAKANLSFVEGPKGECLAGFILVDNTFLRKELSKIITLAFNELKFDKTINWGDYAFIRPLKWMVSFLEEEEIDFSIGEISSAPFSMARKKGLYEKFAVNSYQNYFKNLEENSIVISQSERLKILKNNLHKQGYGNPNDTLSLKAGAYMVETPELVICSFKEKFLALPEKILITNIEEYQRQVSLFIDGNITNKFAVILDNKKSREKAQKSYEKVFNANLEELLMLYEKDKNLGISNHTEKLKSISFQNGLGTYSQKADRIVNLVEYTLTKLELDKNILRRASQLLKFDLATNLVGDKDYAELKGYVGYKYAQDMGEDESVAKLIYDHYLPQFPGDKLPSSLEGAVLSIVDKMDNLVGAAILNRLPTGASDPLYVKRDIVGIIRNIIEYGIEINIVDLLDFSIKEYQKSGVETNITGHEIFDYLNPRIEYHLCSIFPKLVVKAVSHYFENINDSYLRAKALFDFSKSQYFNQFIQANKRIKNIIEGYSNIRDIKITAKSTYEKKLYLLLQELSIDRSIGYLEQLNNYAQGVEIIDDFFENTVVLSDDEHSKLSRIYLLSKLKNIFNSVAELSYFE